MALHGHQWYSMALTALNGVSWPSKAQWPFKAIYFVSWLSKVFSDPPVFHVSPWSSMALNGVEGPSIALKGTLCCFMAFKGLNGVPWPSLPLMVFHSVRWPAMVFHGPQWCSKALHSSEKPYIALKSPPLPYKAL